jgi:hypothetical protein
MASLFAQYGNWLLLIVGSVFVGAAFWTAQTALQTRRAAYYALRQEAIRHMRQRMAVTLVLLVVFAGLAITLNLQPPVPAPTPAAVISTPTPISLPPTPTLLPSATPSPPPSLTLLPTPTWLPSATPRSTLPPQMLTPLPAAASPAPAARLTFTTLASVLDNNSNPVDAGRIFPAGTRSVRIFFHAVNVDNGVTWSVLCLKDKRVVDSVASPWKWGPRAQGARAFCAIDGSLGTYTVTAYLGLVQQFEATFEVVPASTLTPEPTATGTPQP